MKAQIINISNEKYQLAAPLILRLIIGVGFIAYGWVKLSKGAPSGFEKLLTHLEVP